MDLKKIRVEISRFSGWLGLNLCSLIVNITPFRWLYGFAKNVSFLGYKIASRQRRIALESLALAFGQEKSPLEIAQIAGDCFTSMAKSAIELMFLIDKPRLLEKRVGLSGEDNLKQALSKGKGVILVSAHFGNFPLLLSRLSLAGYPVSGIMRPMRDERVEKIFVKKRERYKVKTIYSQPRKACVDTAIRTLRDNEIVFIPIDQNFGTGGVFVNFFGRKAATATGPVVLAQRTQAALMPCFIVRQPDDTHQIFFEPEIALEIKESPEETIVANIEKLTGVIEAYIRKYPAQWGWMHRRWKTEEGK